MDLSEVKRIVEANLETYKLAFGIPHWQIDIEYKANIGDDDGDLIIGENSLNLDYEQAAIRLVYPEFEDEAKLLNVLRHELFHCLASPENFFADVVRRHLTEGMEGNDKVWNTLHRIHTHACEGIVKNIERMYVGMCELSISRNELVKFKPELGPIGETATRKNGKPKTVAEIEAYGELPIA